MKKYKVITDNLDWYGIQEFAIITFKDNLDIVIDNPFIDKKYRRYCILEDDKFKIKLLLNQHPSWFEKIEEDKFELEEKDWEILEWFVGNDKYTEDNIVYKIVADIETGCEHALKIHKVKRLPDGEIFTVGENVKSSLMQTYQSDEIKEFFISKNEMNVHFGHFSTPLRAIIKIKQPTLKTEDGKELCDGQVFYCIDINNIDNDIMQGVFFSRLPRYSNNYKIFSSKEEAEQYIKDNKPQFNKKDMIEFAEYFRNNYNHADCKPAYPLAIWLRKRKK